MKKLFLLLTLLISVFLGAENITVYKTPLNEGIPALRKAGWAIGSKGFEDVDGVFQITASNNNRFYATYCVPVEAGESYGGSVMVKSISVHPRSNSDRNATFFFGFLDAEKHWVTGGEFPRGVIGQTEWTKITIGMTRAIPPKVKFIQIWLVIEGQGTAQFKDLEIHKIDMNSIWKVNADNNPPTFIFNTFGETTGSRVAPRLRIILSQNPDFPKDQSFAEISDRQGSYTFPYALAPGKWFAKSHWITTKSYPETKAITFTIKDVPDNAPLKITPDIHSGKFNATPKFTFTFYPNLPKSYSATLDGKPLDVQAVNGNSIVFAPKDTVAKGTYDIVLTTNAQNQKFLFINKDPAHKFTFRDDNMLMIDGKPFFPIGTYRDPSDDLTVFDGIEEAKFNVTHSYRFENQKVTDGEMVSYLDDCQKHNVFAFMGIPRRHLHSEDAYALQKHCAAMYDHPGTLSYYLADEPELWINKYSMKKGADAVKEGCPGVPRIILLCSPSPNNDDILFLGDGLSEIFWHDPYPIPRKPITSVKETMEASRLICRDKQSLWCVVQAYDWRQREIREKNIKPEDVEPKAGQIRCMTHLALAANVQGIIYYWLPRVRYDMRKHSPIQWAETVATSHELNALYKYLIGRNKPQKITLPEGIDYWCRQAEDGSYAVGIINTTDKEMSFDINVLNFNKKVTLGPWGVEVLK